MDGVDAEAAKRAVGDVVRELFDQVQVALRADAAGDAFERAGDALDANATGHALAAGLFRQIVTAVHGPADHARIARQHLHDAGADDGPGVFERLEVEWRGKLGEWQRAALHAA